MLCGMPSLADRPWQGRQQAAPRRRGHRDPARGCPDRRQPARLDPVRGAAGRPARGPYPDRPSAVAARQGPCRQGLRSSALPRLPARSRDHRTDRPAWDRVVQAARTPPLAGRADHRLAAWLSAAAGPVRHLRRALLQLCAAGLLVDLLSDPHQPTMVSCELASPAIGWPAVSRWPRGRCACPRHTQRRPGRPARRPRGP
jgi:hypothetical protein